VRKLLTALPLAFALICPYSVLAEVPPENACGPFSISDSARAKHGPMISIDGARANFGPVIIPEGARAKFGPVIIPEG
jgi:hypothetical protein